MNRIWLLIVALAAASLSAPFATAEDGPAGWMDPRIGQAKLALRYGATHLSEQGVKGQATDLSLTEHALDVTVPVWQTDTQELSLLTVVRVLDIASDAMLLDAGKHLPEHLWDVRLGATYRIKFGDGWITGANVMVGSASDKPFHSEDEWLVTATPFLRIPSGQRNAWVVYLNVSNVREFLPLVPLPGGGFLWHPNDRFRWLIGAPYTELFAEPLDRLEVEASYLLLRTVHAEVRYAILDRLTVYGGFDWFSRRYFRAGRDDEDDRLFYYAKRVGGGVRWEITENVSVDVFAGYGFDRFFFEGADYDDRGDNRISIDDGCFGGIRLGVQF